jgi:hypothetical protein
MYISVHVDISMKKVALLMDWRICIFLAELCAVQKRSLKAVTYFL